MPFSRARSFTCLFCGLLLAVAILPALLVASPTGEHLKGDDADAHNRRAADTTGIKKMARNRRNVSWYKQHSDFWGWYKYFTDTGNQDGLEELDRVYLAYLQNKNRAEGRRSYNLYLRHLGAIYKSCAESSDPDCIASYLNKPKPTSEGPRPAPMKGCDPYRDPYCLQSRAYPIMSSASAKAPALARAPVVNAPSKALGSGYYYSPASQSFLSAKQKAELLRICDDKDVECLQYHLRAAYGYNAGPAPSYAHLGCDPKKDPGCHLRLVQRAPAGLYHRYPTCDPNYDPYCMPQAAQNFEASSADQPCNPLLDDNCNPLTATRLASVSRPDQETGPRDEPAQGVACDPRYDPYCLYHASAAPMQRHSSPPPQPRFEEETRYHLGPRGKTKEGYDCYMFYDKECIPLDTQTDVHKRAASSTSETAQPVYGDIQTNCHPFDPNCGKRAPYRQAGSETYEPHLNPDGTRNGVIEPDPDCDPEYDRNCRLRRVEETKPQDDSVAEERSQEKQTVKEHPLVEPIRQDEHHYRGEPYQDLLGYGQQPEAPVYEQQHYDPYQSGQEDPYANYASQDQMPTRLEDGMGEYGRYDDSHDHRAYSGEYRKK